MNHRHLEKARTAVAELIHNRHFAVYPYWPAWGETQESIIRVKKHDHYPSVNMEVFWSVFGYITVTVSGCLELRNWLGGVLQPR